MVIKGVTSQIKEDGHAGGTRVGGAVSEGNGSWSNKESVRCVWSVRRSRGVTQKEWRCEMREGLERM